MPLTLSDFDYALPPELIAQAPLAERAASRLLHVHGESIDDRHFGDIAELLRPGDLVVINDTRVLKARLFGVKDSGGRIEVLVERVTGPCEVLAQVRASKSPRPGSTLRLEEAINAEVIEREGEFYRLRFAHDASALELLERHGRMPLPPYIGRSAEPSDAARYQTVYARTGGSVAAPTAGLHFDTALLNALQTRGCAIATVTLHVGAGTFQPVRVDDLSLHRMHRERYELPRETTQAIAAAKDRGGRVVAVGTTTLRTLEAVANDAAARLHKDEPLCAVNHASLCPGSGETDLFILPGFQFRIVDALITNFHLPKSTLLMLVSAFGGLANLRRAYAHAVAQRYRFFSYGDAMLIERETE
jgi:S-adenosylmethionine:tRNA ribosyltransferase-isomerase